MDVLVSVVEPIFALFEGRATFRRDAVDKCYDARELASTLIDSKMLRGADIN